MGATGTTGQPSVIAEGLAGSAVQTSTQTSAVELIAPAALVLTREGKSKAPSETANPLVKRDPKTGRVLPGSTLNPGGRRPGLRAIMNEVVDFRAVISMVADIAYGKLAPAARMNDRLKAAELLLAYQFGKPTQTLNLDDKTRPPSVDPKALTTDRLNALRATLRASLTDITDAELVE